MLIKTQRIFTSFIRNRYRTRHRHTQHEHDKPKRGAADRNEIDWAWAENVCCCKVLLLFYLFRFDVSHGIHAVFFVVCLSCLFSFKRNYCRSSRYLVPKTYIHTGKSFTVVAFSSLCLRLMFFSLIDFIFTSFRSVTCISMPFFHHGY